MSDSSESLNRSSSPSCCKFEISLSAPGEAGCEYLTGLQWLLMISLPWFNGDFFLHNLIFSGGPAGLNPISASPAHSSFVKILKFVVVLLFFSCEILHDHQLCYTVMVDLLLYCNSTGHSLDNTLKRIFDVDFHFIWLHFKALASCKDLLVLSRYKYV